MMGNGALRPDNGNEPSQGSSGVEQPNERAPSPWKGLSQELQAPWKRIAAVLVVAFGIAGLVYGISSIRTQMNVLGDEFRFESLGCDFILDSAVGTGSLKELLPRAPERAHYSMNEDGECLEWVTVVDGKSIRYEVSRVTTRGELLLGDEVTRVTLTEIKVENLSEKRRDDHTKRVFRSRLGADVPETNRGLRLGDSHKRVLKLYGRPLEVMDFPEPLPPYRSLQYIDSSGAFLGLVEDRVTEEVLEISVAVGEPAREDTPEE